MINSSKLAKPAVECVALKDVDLIYRACSRSFAEAMGFISPDQLIGKTDIDLFAPEEALQMLKLESELVLTGKSSVTPCRKFHSRSHNWAAERLVLRKPVYSDGNIISGIDIKIVIEPFNESGDKSEPEAKELKDTRTHSSHSGISIDHLTTRQSDISVVRKAQNTDFRQLTDRIPHGVVIFRGVKLLYANRAAAGLLGYVSQTELMRTGFVSSILRIDEWIKRHSASQLPVNARQSQIAERFELQGIHKDGHSLVLDAQAQEVFWLNEKAVLMSFVDRTEQALTEQMLVESELRFKSYAEASADFFWEMDENLKFTYLSEEIEHALGIPVKQLIGGSSQELAFRSDSEDVRDHWTEQLDRLLHHQRFADFEFKWDHPDGSERVIRYSGIPVYDENGQFRGYRGSGRDITESHRSAEAVAYHASHDSLTGLVNRRKFEESTKAAINSARDYQETHALCFMDLDNFKIVNDSGGHQAGDELLRQLSLLFQEHVRKSDVLARIGGDEFAVLLYNCGVSEALRLANQLRSEVENFQFLWEDNRYAVGVSVGVVLIDKRWENTNSLFRAADMACYLAKDRGRNRVVVYQDSEVRKNVRQGETHWIDQINAAIGEHRLKISRQKILPLKNNGRHFFEILMRLVTPSGAIINPQAFLPTAERYGLATKLDETVLDITFAWLEKHPGILDELGMCCINLTGQSFANELFTDSMVKKINNSNVPADRLCFELSETATVASLSSASKFMHLLGRIGCSFSLDNFGSGLSSFAYMKNLPVQYLKIDGIIVRDILEDPIDFAMVKAINEIGQTLGKKTIASCVENGQLLSHVRELGIDYAQGFHVGHPEIIDVRRNLKP